MSGPIEKKPGKKKHGKGSRKAKPSQNQKPDQIPEEQPEPLQSHKLEQLASSEPEPPQSPQPEQLQSPEPEPLQSHQPEPLQSHQPEPLQSLKPEQLASEKQEPCQDGNRQFEPAAASEPPLSVDFQTLATAYGNYTKKSFEQTQAFVEKLSGVRSLDKAVEIQTEFAKQAYETFVTESQKIRELYRGLAKKNLQPFEGLVARKTPTAH